MLWLTLFNIALFTFSVGLHLRPEKAPYLVKLRSTFCESQDSLQWARIILTDRQHQCTVQPTSQHTPSK